MKQGQLFPDERTPLEPRLESGTPTPLERINPVNPERTGDSDASARRLAVSDFSRPLMLEAGAGTGKTATLVGRVVAWAMGPGWEERASAPKAPEELERIAPLVLEGISAITFTEAAAAEMSTRVGRVLRDLEAAAEDDLPIGLERSDLPADHRDWSLRARALRASLDRLTTCTIHAFCRRLLAAHPLELGLDPYFELDARQTRVPMCVREVLEEFFQERWGKRDEEDLLALAERGYGPPEIESALLDLMDKGARADDFREEPMGASVCAALTSELEDSLRELAGYIEALSAVPKNQKTHVLLHALSDATALLGDDAENRTGEAPGGIGRFERWQDRLRELFPDGARDKLKAWRKGKFTKTEGKYIEGVETELSRCAERFETALGPLLELDHEHLERVRTLTHELLSRIEARVRARGLATFNDLLRDAQRLLNSFPEVAAAERRRIRQLLVDEFQDTDEGQCDIVRQLALRGPQEERPTLFCVGDPKQSIYAWRSADLLAYDTFARELSDSGGAVLRLTRNFRSLPGILEEVDRSVGPVMDRIEGVQPEFVGLEAHRTASSSGTRREAVEFWPSWPLDEGGQFETSLWQRTQAGYEAEARAIAVDVAQLSAEGTAFRDVALLFRAATGVEVYLRALRERDIPYVVQSDRSYYRRREVVDAGALVRCVLDPLDQLALVTLLRSPWVGVPDAALFALWSAGFPDAAARLSLSGEAQLAPVEEAIAQASKNLPTLPVGVELGGWGDSLSLAMHAIARLRASFELETVDRWISQLRRYFLPDAIESARFLGAFRRSNLERFFRELETTFEDRGDVHGVLATLRTSLGREVEAEVTRPSDSEVNAVRVLTIHGSKGLEFEHVYLAQAHKLPPGEMGGDLLFEKRGATPAYALLGAKSPGAFEAQKRASLAESAERVRLLYVAMTRAKERLVVLGAFAAAPKRETWRYSRRFTDLLEHREGLEEALSELRQAPPGHEHRDAFGCLFRSAIGIAGDAEHEQPAQRALVDSHLERLPTPATVTEQARLLERRRHEAQEHQARPWSLSASAASHPPPATPGPEKKPHQQHGHHHDTDHDHEEQPQHLPRRAAQAVGVAVHRALELCDLQNDPATEFALHLQSLPTTLAELLPESEIPPAQGRAQLLLEGMRENGLWQRFFELGDAILAREIDVVLPPSATTAADTVPTGFFSGTIDLLYRCPQTQELVIADYKSDVIDNEETLEQRVAGYRAQGRTYVQALREALQLDYDPRFELWFLHPGRVVMVGF